MSPVVKQKVMDLIDKHFIGQNNDELVIKKNDINLFLQEFSELVISRTIDVAFGMKEINAKQTRT
jgi:hypothetical protein